MKFELTDGVRTAVYEGTDTVVLFEELAYQEVLPIAWRAGLVAAHEQALHQERNAKLMQLCLALEERTQPEKLDEKSAVQVDLLRMDLKINLLLELVGRLISTTSSRPPAQPLRFNAQGATWPSAGKQPLAGEFGVLDIYLRECLVEPLRLYGQVVDHEGVMVRVKFQNLGETVIDQLEKLSFRRHRRLLAGARNLTRASY